MDKHIDHCARPTPRPEAVLSAEAKNILRVIVGFQERLSQWDTRMGGQSSELLDKSIIRGWCFKRG